MCTVPSRCLSQSFLTSVQFTLGMYGDGDFFTMKGVVEEFFRKGRNGFKAPIMIPAQSIPTFILEERPDILYDGKNSW